MYDQLREETLYIMLYAVVITIAMLASCYLLFRRANAIAPNVTPPVRLRRWTAAFFAAKVTKCGARILSVRFFVVPSQA
jgi:hypothetical protein